MTVRLARALGMEAVVAYAERFGVVDELPRYLPMALGAGETTLLRLTTAYGMLVNGGKRIEPALIERIQDRHGRTVYRRDARPCPDCLSDGWNGQAVPRVLDDRPRVVGADTAFQMVWIMRGVVERGTGRRIRELGKPLAGKTGTTNDNKDTWFIGFSPDLVAGVFIGFDRPRPLGYKRDRLAGRGAGVQALHGRGAGRLAGDPLPHPARRAPGAHRRRHRVVARRDHRAGDPRGIQARHRAVDQRAQPRGRRRRAVLGAGVRRGRLRAAGHPLPPWPILRRAPTVARTGARPTAGGFDR